MKVAPRDAQYPYQVIGTPGSGFVAEADFKALVHELHNLKVERNQIKKELESYGLPEDIPEDAPPDILWAEILRLRHALKGPDGFKTWQDAAVDERQRRVQLEQGLGKGKSEADKKRDLDIEAEAKRIYNGWKDQRGWTPWVGPGNSHMQERARDLARISVSASNIAARSL